MTTTLALIKDAVTYKRIHYPFDPEEVLAYLNVRNFVKPNGAPFEVGDIAARLQDAVTNGDIVFVHGMYWFPDIPVTDRQYLRGLLHNITKKASLG